MYHTTTEVGFVPVLAIYRNSLLSRAWNSMAEKGNPATILSDPPFHAIESLFMVSTTKAYGIGIPRDKSFRPYKTDGRMS